MSKLVILTVNLDEAKAVRAVLERIPVPSVVSSEFKCILAFNAKLAKSIQHTEGVKRRV